MPSEELRAVPGGPAAASSARLSEAIGFCLGCCCLLPLRVSKPPGGGVPQSPHAGDANTVSRLWEQVHGPQTQDGGFPPSRRDAQVQMAGRRLVFLAVAPSFSSTRVRPLVFQRVPLFPLPFLPCRQPQTPACWVPSRLLLFFIFFFSTPASRLWLQTSASRIAKDTRLTHNE